MSAISDFIFGAKQTFENSLSNETIEVIGNNKIIIENTSKIFEYKTELVRLGVGKRIITILGGQLKLNDYSDKSIVIDGIIKNISFE